MLRVEALDQDTFTQDDVVEHFDCGPIPTIRLEDVVENTEQSSQWSAPQDCKGFLQGGQVKLAYRYRAYQVPSTTCVVSVATDNDGTVTVI